ncbi:hypothetical protein CPB84DRAFT_1537565 [Gymnopilus junonius]|uniref:Uncharacterized protein n=1 Tax=Gymnopilus junonius TaxID=109634 RepID=A0A9P5TJ18_GYMJU|nr:hypothetical protein CPB84DRAFT_1537565 [Gymnopilus junonius]
MFTILRARAVISSARMATASSRRFQIVSTSQSSMHTSSVARDPKHTTDSYSREVDDSPPLDDTVHRVDPFNVIVQKPNRDIDAGWTATDQHPSSVEANKHTTDSYLKNEEADPVAPGSTVYTVDASKPVEKPNEPSPSGEWSRAGAQTEEYRHVEGAEKGPYTPKNGGKGSYGGQDSWAKTKEPKTSKPDKGPEAKSSGRRK